MAVFHLCLWEYQYLGPYFIGLIGILLLLLHFGFLWVFNWIDCNDYSINARHQMQLFGTFWCMLDFWGTFLIFMVSFGSVLAFRWIDCDENPSLHQLQRCFTEHHWIYKWDLQYTAAGTSFVKITFSTTTSTYIQITNCTTSTSQTSTTPCLVWWMSGVVDVQCGGYLVWWMSYFTHSVVDVWCGQCLVWWMSGVVVVLFYPWCIFVSRKWYDRISEYICMKSKDMKFIRMDICINNYMNIWLFEYLSHSARVWFWYKWISEYICIKKTIQTYIRIYLYQTNQ